MTVLAIDQGTTSTRAVLVGPDGTTTPLLSREHRQSYPQPGWVEHDGEELLADIAACLDAAGGHGVAAVGLDNQGESCLAWDADTGRPLCPVIVWQDDRTRAATDRLRADGYEALVGERAGLPLDPYFSAAKLGWIVRNVPEAARLAEAGRLRLGTTDAFFRDRLTGRFETDVATASRTSLMALDTCAWDTDLCTIFGVPVEALPPIGPTSGDLGRVRCGEAEVPFTASIVDQQAALYGHGCRAPGEAKITCGTGAFLLAVTGSRPAAWSGALPTVLWQRSGEAPVFGLDGGVYAAAAAVNWARRIGLFQDFAEINRFDAPPAIGRGLAFVPALAGLACPHWDRSARGAFVGLSLDTTAADMIQAILEGIALRIAEVAHAIAAVHPLASPIPVDGGMSANPAFVSMLANALGCDVRIADAPDVTAAGTAALAAEAIGRPIAPPRTGRVVAATAPDPDAATRFAAAVAASRQFAATTRT
ncbi:glycerol kinase [Acuticoccus sediminis]|uniref:ATP:glycerol 3-phosphotransferase n=1 Tax=Acuticoccus sediminis TaxID=2184697 RepID=A0A8B2NX06_9HYPH|nr:FGGY family carbohydrate kinase [Acuticoccus sediminis]RAI03903.1 glycerol kinase [Acuticoccus sediminis]